MKVDFVRFKASDNVELQGWLTNEKSDIAVLHIHGRSGNGYENYFLDDLRKMYSKHSVSFFTIDTRGRGFISDFRQHNGWKLGGSVYEIFEESAYDIQGALDYLKTLGKKRFILQGHSLGCTKAVHYLTSQNTNDILAAVLIAPTDMVGVANTDSKHQMYLKKARVLTADGKGETLVGIECWFDKIPISAQTYPTICEEGSNADIYGSRKGGALLGRIQLPMLIPYGDNDIGILKIDGSINKWLARTNKIKNDHTDISIITGAEHGFRGYEKELANIISSFLGKEL